MPLSIETSIHSRISRTLARAALAVMACAGLAGCGGGGSGGDAQVTIMPPSPDLVVESPSVSDDRPAAGANFTLSARVRNAGSAVAAATTARFYRSTDETIETSDTPEGAAFEVAELAAEESVDASVELSAPSTPRTYYYGACVDAVEGESDTANNCSEEPVEVTVPAPQPPEQEPQAPPPGPQIPSPGPRTPPPNLPDLVAFWVSHDRPAIGGFFRLSVRVRNPRIRGSAPTTVRVYRSMDSAFATAGAQAHVFRVPKLNLYSSHTSEAFVKAPSSAGLYYYRACMDAANDCSEAVKVELEHYKPNLLIHGKSWHSPRQRGGRFPLQAHIRNFGGPSEATTLRFILLPGRTSPPSSGTQVGAVEVPALVTPFQRSLGTNGGFYGSIYPKAPSAPGEYYYVACVDAVPEESDTTDNCTLYSIEVP